MSGKQWEFGRSGPAALRQPQEHGKPFDAEAFWADIDVLSGREFPAPTDDDLDPGLDDETMFEGSQGR